MGYPISYYANSTGVSAHKDYDKAFLSALFELVERDAIAVTWYSKRKPNILLDKNFSEDVIYRVKSLKKINREVRFLDITLDTIPVVLCVIIGNKFPYFVSGCSANPDLDKAVTKAFNEAELMFHSWRTVKRNKVKVKKVSSCTDHADFYAQTPLFKNKNLRWLLGGKVKRFKEIDYSISNLIKKVDPVVINLNPNNYLPCDLHVLRVMSDKLIPLTFGYMSEHYQHPRLKELGLKWAWSFPAPPHFFA